MIVKVKKIRKGLEELDKIRNIRATEQRKFTILRIFELPVLGSEMESRDGMVSDKIS